MKIANIIFALIIGLLSTQFAQAAVALDRTRVIFNGADKSMSLNIENKNTSLPYLAQSWLEDENGKKVNSPFTPLPPIQRLEPGAKSQVKLQSMLAEHSLPQDKETIFYFNLREIPPKSDKPNTLQIALQTRIKFFYRPEAIAVKVNDKPFQERLTLVRSGDEYMVNNPTPYYITLINAAKSSVSPGVLGFQPMMIPPKGNSVLLGGKVSELGATPVLTYINDFGGRPKLVFKCDGNTCKVANVERG